MQAPDRFSEAVRVALDDEMPTLRPAVFRARYHFSEVVRLADLTALIDRIGARGTHGLFLKAPDEPEIASSRVESPSSRSSQTCRAADVRPMSAWTTAPPGRRRPISSANGLAGRRR